MAAEILFKNAPLVEVIAEVRWRLEPVIGMGDAAVDPHFSTFTEKFQQQAHQRLKFRAVEQLAPPGTPLQLLPYRPITRFRKSENGWPLYQIGPGIFTVNIVPPYGGWSKFIPTIRRGLAALWDSYPFANRLLNVRRFELRYINGFTAKHGFMGYAPFSNTSLTPKLTLPQSFNSFASNPRFVGEIHIDLKRPANAQGSIGYTPGKVRDEEALIMQLAVTSRSVPKTASAASTLTWLQSAHEDIREMFKAVMTPSLRTKVGPEATSSAKK